MSVAHVGRMSAWPIEVLSLGPVVGAATPWQTRAGLGLTIVAKSTFSIAEESATFLEQPERIVVTDEHVDGSPLRSVERASDLAPHRLLADVTMIGHAYAPSFTSMRAMSVRLGVFQGSAALLDKTISVTGDANDAGATVPFERMPLVYERAARSLDNPVGTMARANLRNPTGVEAAPSFGPISPFWRTRSELLQASDRASVASRLPTLESSFPWAYFQAAPVDQRIGYLRGDEWIVIDGVHASRPRVASRLPAARTAARVAFTQGGARKSSVLRLLLDTLAIDADRLTASVVWRGRVLLPAGVAFADVDAEIGLELPNVATAWPSARAGSWRSPTPVPSSEPAPNPPLPPPPPSPRPSPPPLGKPMGRTMALDFTQQAALSDVAALPFRRVEGPKRSYSPPPLTWQEVIAPRPPSEPPASPAPVDRDPSAIAGPARKSPAIPIVNATTFSATTLAWQLHPPQASLTVIVKGTFDLSPMRARAESDLVTGDLYVGGDEAKSLAYASDFAVIKPLVDVTCVGHAYPPGGEGVATQVELSLGALRRKVAVFGDRRWNTTLGVRSAPTAPASFTSMPLVYERAFGGPSSALNPVGLGKDGVLLPNLEDPDRLIRAPGDAPAPACFAPIALTWPERAKKLGTYGGSYRAKRWPYFAEDFDAAYFQAAPASQRLERVNGDESFKIVGMHPERASVEGKLPGVRARCFVERTAAAGGGFEELALKLDTVAFDMTEGKLNLVWRGLLDVSEEEAPELNALFLVAEALTAEAMTLEAARALYLARVAPPKPIAPPKPAPAPANDVAQSDVAAEVAEQLADLPPPDEAPPDIPMPSPDAIENAMRAAGASDDEIAALLSPPPEPVAEPEVKIARDLGVRGDVIEALATGASLEGRDLTGADLSKLDFSGKSLARAILTRADLSGVKAVGTDFSGVLAARARFTEADLTGARFDGATLTSADFTRATLEDASLAACSAADVRLYDARAARAKFDGANLVGARAAGVHLDGASLRGVQAERSVWEGASIDKAIFATAKLAGSSFVRARGVAANFAAADVKEGRFRRAVIPRAIFLRANLMMATFERACLDEADLRGANLHSAETWNASLEGAQLDTAIVTRSKLAGAR
jgi:uncharacterized protein YjbI with pentapeptide repeats